jgi:aminobenzoyl-glutamate utilization protein B
MPRTFLNATVCITFLLIVTYVCTAAEPTLRPAHQSAVAEIDRLADSIKSVNQSLWKWAEVGLEEHRSSKLLVEKLREAGFEVKTGVSGMPTAFVASYGSGKPIIGILAEYDALPGMSQKVAPQQEPEKDGAPGHACGHSGLGSGALGAALAAKAAMVKHGIQGTVRRRNADRQSVHDVGQPVR